MQWWVVQVSDTVKVLTSNCENRGTQGVQALSCVIKCSAASSLELYAKVFSGTDCFVTINFTNESLFDNQTLNFE